MIVLNQATVRNRSLCGCFSCERRGEVGFVQHLAFQLALVFLSTLVEQNFVSVFEKKS